MLTAALFQADGSSKPENIMMSNTTTAEWKLELERVLPQLKVTIRTDNKVAYRPLALTP